VLDLEAVYIRGKYVGFQAVIASRLASSFLAFEKGSRRKGETTSRHYRSNGYVLNQKSSKLKA
jgi:hypothetical protein